MPPPPSSLFEDVSRIFNRSSAGVKRYAGRVPLGKIALGAGVGVGAYAGFHNKEAGDDLGDKAGSAAAYGLVGGLAGVGAYKYGPSLMRAANRPSERLVKGVGSSLYGTTRNFIDSRRMARGGAKISRLESFTQTFGRRTGLFLGTGAAIGAAVGSHYDETGKGAAIGAGAGLLAQAGISATANYRRMRAIPGWGPGLSKAVSIMALATIAIGGVTAAKLTHNDMPPPDYASPDIGGGYDSSSQPGGMSSGVGLHGLAMKVGGDLVMGLHGKRHG